MPNSKSPALLEDTSWAASPMNDLNFFFKSDEADSDAGACFVKIANENVPDPVDGEEEEEDDDDDKEEEGGGGR